MSLRAAMVKEPDSNHKTIRVQEVKSPEKCNNLVRANESIDQTLKSAKCSKKDYKTSTITPKVKSENQDNEKNNIDIRNIEKQNKDLPSLDWEKTSHEEKASIRFELFKSIISSNAASFSWKNLLLFSIGTTIVGFSVTLPHLLIPAGDLVKDPENWYEILFHGVIYIIITRFSWCYQASSLMNLHYLHSKRFVSITCLSGAIVMVLLIIFSYLIWTPFLKYRYPIPFLGLTLTYLLRLLVFVEMWYLIPLDWRQKKSLKKRLQFLFLYIFFTIVTIIISDFITTIVKKSSPLYQPFIALLFPILREMTEIMSEKLIRYSADGDKQGAIIVVKYTIATRYTIRLCMIIGGAATTATSWLLIAVDFSMNIYLCLRIIWLRKRETSLIQDQIEKLQQLAVYELVEFQAPLALMLVLSVAYHGPNGALFGNILNCYWTFNVIEDCSVTIINMAILFVVDFSSTVICAILLLTFVKINLWKVFLTLQEEFGKIFCITLGQFLVLVSTKYITKM